MKLTTSIGTPHKLLDYVGLNKPHFLGQRSSLGQQQAQPGPATPLNCRFTILKAVDIVGEPQDRTLTAMEVGQSLVS